MLDSIKSFLIDEGFSIVKEKENNIKFVGFFGFTVTIQIIDSVIYFERSLGTEREYIAQRYKLESYEDFLYIVTKSMRSPMFQIT
ncbi:hypothetical protein [Flavobacterium sp. TAB 87]|uniref:hypothetical protein n=1 Tax=Flavobacterium sp. TAB 87 TaxID=1729581 RepID=UPI00076BD1EE|nr:hypothetical protein [Flavobacterium sp. TAB 87]KVV16249.1 hypothetical protein AP058_00238 [Flavobacterium sp. TAB 87]